MVAARRRWWRPVVGVRRRVFHATPAGHTVAARTALALIEEPKPVQHPILAGLAFTTSRDETRWYWTLMIMVPDWLYEVRLEGLVEGRCVQTLHIGSYDDEAELLEQMHHEFIPTHGLTMVGKHHEIYLSDARKVALDRLRTILRQPVRAIGG